MEDILHHHYCHGLALMLLIKKKFHTHITIPKKVFTEIIGGDFNKAIEHGILDQVQER
jgi:hypothetical protein